MVRDRSASPSPEAAVVRDRSASPSLRAAIVRDRSASAPRLAPRSRAVASPPARGMDELRTRAPSHVVTPKPGHRACNPGRVPSLAQQSIAADGHRSSPAFACSLRRPRLNANVGPLQFARCPRWPEGPIIRGRNLLSRRASRGRVGDRSAGRLSQVCSLPSQAGSAILHRNRAPHCGLHRTPRVRGGSGAGPGQVGARPPWHPRERARTLPRCLPADHTRSAASLSWIHRSRKHRRSTPSRLSLVTLSSAGRSLWTPLLRRLRKQRLRARR